MLSGLASILFPNSPVLYLLTWGFTLHYGLYGVISYVVRKQSWSLLILIFILVAFLISFGIIRSINLQNYESMILIDLIGQIIRLGVSLYIIIDIVKKDTFFEEMEAYFIFIIFSFYSALQVLSTIMVHLNFFENFDFCAYSIRFLLIMWLVSIPWMRHLKRKHS